MQGIFKEKIEDIKNLGLVQYVNFEDLLESVCVNPNLLDVNYTIGHSYTRWLGNGYAKFVVNDLDVPKKLSGFLYLYIEDKGIDTNYFGIISIDILVNKEIIYITYNTTPDSKRNVDGVTHEIRASGRTRKEVVYSFVGEGYCRYIEFINKVVPGLTSMDNNYIVRAYSVLIDVLLGYTSLTSVKLTDFLFN